MKLPSTKGTIGNKDKIIGVINEFFDTEFITKTARLKKFVERESKLGGLIFFFSACLPQRKKGLQVWTIYAGNFTKMGLKSGNKVCRGGLISQHQTLCELWLNMPYQRNWD